MPGHTGLGAVDSKDRTGSCRRWQKRGQCSHEEAIGITLAMPRAMTASA